jgi:hypothetical protein
MTDEPIPARRDRWLDRPRRLESGIFFGFWLGLMFIGRSGFLRDGDTFWHVRTGEAILATGRLPTADAFSFTFLGRPWTAHEWLAEAFMAALHRVGGWDALVLVTATSLAGLYAWVAGRLLRSGLALVPSVLVVLLGFAVGASGLHARPHILTIVLIGILFAKLIDFEAGRISLRGLVVLVPLFVIWTNGHGGMLGGLGTLGLFAAAWGLPRLASAERPRALGLFAITLACGLTAFVNPYGASLPWTWLDIVTSTAIPLLIDEHRPPDPTSAEFATLVLAGLAYLLALASTLPRRPRVTWLIPLVWLMLALFRVRHGVLFGVTAALALGDLLPESRLAQWLAQPARDLFRSEPAASGKPGRPFVLPLLVFLAVLACQASGARAPLVGRGWARLDPEHWPVDLLPDLDRLARQAHGDGRIFNDYRLGGFLISQAPGLKVFIDGRCELYGDPWLEAFAQARDHDPGLVDTWADRDHFEIALVLPGVGFDRFLAKSSGWTLIRRAPSGALYQRKPSTAAP